VSAGREAVAAEKPVGSSAMGDRTAGDEAGAGAVEKVRTEAAETGVEIVVKTLAGGGLSPRECSHTSGQSNVSVHRSNPGLKAVGRLLTTLTAQYVG
jgi:hypothetical protein